MRLAPTHNANKVVEMLREHFMRPGDDTFGALVEFEVVDAAEGFCAPDLPPHVKEIVNSSVARVHGGKLPFYQGCGGAIPFMTLFAEAFPKAHYVLSGVDGIENNAHAANENMDLEQCNKFTATMAIILSRL